MRILIVEDEQIIAADLASQLARLGHEVVGMASEGQEAIDLAERARPGLVLMDIQLEGEMAGTEAARAIQERTGAEILFVTAFPNILLREPAGLARPAVCLGKPFSHIQLEAALDAALRKRA
jgi:CheY-like chemotaxis protein